MLNEQEALERVLAKVRPLGVESLPLRKAVGRYSASDLTATVPSPPFDNSSMDGFALAFSGGSAPTGSHFQLVGTQAAGPDAGLTLQTGEAARIFTGAPIPNGTVAVLRQEDAQIEGNVVRVMDECVRDEFIRRAGADLCRGQRILSAGDLLDAQRIALLASQGLPTAEVHRAPRVAIISTGDELVPPGQPLGPGQIYESNGLLLAALVEQSGALVHQVISVRDDPAALSEKLRDALARTDAVVLSGGVSVGDRDYVKPVLASLGVAADFWKVAIKPGRPFLFGVAPGDVPVFGLPGNPVSSFVTFFLFVQPALRRLAGSADPAPKFWPARAGAELSNPDGRPHYMRGRVENGEFLPQGRQESHALFGLSRSNALVCVKPGTVIARGDSLQVLPF